MFSWFRKRRRRKILAKPWPEPWNLHLQRNVRLTWEMDDAEMAALQHRVKIFVAEKHWEGCEGLELTEEMQVTIAAQACLMLLGVDDYYFDNVKTVLIYPKAFRRMTGDGMNEGQSQHRAGEEEHMRSFQVCWAQLGTSPTDCAANPRGGGVMPRLGQGHSPARAPWCRHPNPLVSLADPP